MSLNGIVLLVPIRYLSFASIQFILSVAVFTQFLKQFPLRFVANYEYLKRNDMKRRMLIIISSTHKDFNLHEMS